MGRLVSRRVGEDIESLRIKTHDEIGLIPLHGCKKPWADFERTGEFPALQVAPLLSESMPVFASPYHPAAPGESPGGAMCVAIGVKFLIRNDTAGPQGPFTSFRQEGALQSLITDVRGVLIRDLPLSKRLV